jgi:tetratricopeptide (TPR) repeat protein
MLTLKFPANFVSSFQLPLASLFDLVGTNDASAQIQAVEARLREAQSYYRAGKYQDAVNAYKTAQSLIYTALQPDHSIAGHVLDDAVMLPVSQAIEFALADASLKLAEAIQPVVLTPRAPVTVTGVEPSEELARLASIGFRQDSSVPADLGVGANLGLEHLAQGRIPQAVEVLTDLFDRIGEPATPAENSNAAAVALDLSSAKLIAGEAQEAQSLAERAEGFFRAARDEAGQAQALHNQAVAFRRLQQPDKAQAAFEQSARLYSAVAETWGVAATDGGEPTPATPPSPPGPGPSPLPTPIPFPHIPGHLQFGVQDSGQITLGALTPVRAGLTRAGVAAELTTPLAAAGILSLVTTAGVAAGLVSTRPPVAASAVAGSNLTDLVYLRDKDASVVSVRWPGAGAGWGATALPNPVEVQRDERSWSLNVPAGNEVVSLVWKDGVRPARQKLVDAVYKRRIDATAIGDLIFRPREPGELTAHLTHLYAFVIPQALGDCYHRLGNFRRAEEYYLQAAQYSYINIALEVPALWIRLATNALLWGDHLYKQEQLDAAKEVYRKVVTDAGKAPTGSSPLYDLPVFAGPAADAKKVLAALDDPSAAGVNPGLALPIVTVWQRWQYLLAALDYYGTSYTPIFTFEYLQQVALGFAQQAIQAEQEYVNFQVHAEAEAATRRDLQGALSLSQAEAAGRAEQLKAAEADTAGMGAAVHLADLRAANAQQDRDRYETLGYEQIKFQSVAAAHSAHADWHGDEIRRLARDMEAGSWQGESGKLAAAATLLAGEKSYEYQLGRLDSTVGEMQATRPIAAAQLESAQHRQAAAALALSAAQLRTALTEDALAAFENEVFTPELWARMAQAMLELSRTFQEWAVSGAKLMERAYNFETDSELSVIKGEYPGSETGGLLGSEYLLRDIESFTYHFVAHQRSKETNVKDVVSLATEYPLAFGEFLESGKMAFETTLRDFDVRHPGLFGQRVQSVEVEVIGLMPPEGIRGTLRGGGVSRYRTADEAEKLRVHTVDTMALSEFTVRGDALVYRQDPRMHGLFEGQGVATSWELDLPRRSNNLDYRLITDVRLVVYYNARFDAGLEQAVLTRAPLPGELVHVRDLQLRYDFPEAWYSFLDDATMPFEVVPQQLPRNETNFKTEKVSLRLLLADGVSANGVPITLKLPGKAAVTMSTDGRGEISTQPGNQLEGKMGGQFLGPWQLTVAPESGSPLLGPDGKLSGQLLEQIVIVAQYKFDWPA